MPYRLVPAALAPALLLALFACVGEPSTGPDASGAAADLPIQLALIEGPADGTALPINRIRAVVRAYSVDVDGVATAGQILAEERFDVDPAARSWEIDVRVPLEPRASARVVVQLSLIHASGATERVEFSGTTEPVLLEQGSSVEPADVTLVRGPLSNLFATGVTIVAPPEVAVVGVPVPLYATATTTAQEAPSVFWVSLDPAVGTVAGAGADAGAGTDAGAGAVLTGVAEGTVRVAAAAGAHADTLSIGVLAAPADPALYMYGSTLVVAEGDTFTLSLVALNDSGASLDGASVSLTLPAGLVPTAWETSAGTVDAQAGRFTWAIGALAAGEAHTLTLDVRIDPAAQLAGRGASVQGELLLPQTFQDPDVGNNLAGWFVQVVAPPL